MILVADIIKHARDRAYMSGVERDRTRIKAKQEIFTPTAMAIDLVKLVSESMFTDSRKTFFDPTCGDGQLLSEILIRKIETIDKEKVTEKEFEQALLTIYGVDIMADNVALCRDRLLCGYEEYRNIVEANVLIGNTLDPFADVDGQTIQDKERMIELFASDVQKVAHLRAQIGVASTSIDPAAADLFIFTSN